MEAQHKKKKQTNKNKTPMEYIVDMHINYNLIQTTRTKSVIVSF